MVGDCCQLRTCIAYPSQPPVLMSRFMLNLREIRTDSNFQSYSTAIPQFQVSLSDCDRGAFTSIIGNIGEPLVHGENEGYGPFP